MIFLIGNIILVLGQDQRRERAKKSKGSFSSLWARRVAVHLANPIHVKSSYNVSGAEPDFWCCRASGQLQDWLNYAGTFHTEIYNGNCASPADSFPLGSPWLHSTIACHYEGMAQQETRCLLWYQPLAYHHSPVNQKFVLVLLNGEFK